MSTVPGLAASALLLVACSVSTTASLEVEAERATAPVASAHYDPLAAAKASIGKTVNAEAGVPPMCYTKTGGDSNPCFVCHTSPSGANTWSDWELQSEYSFSDAALTNQWTNLFRDRSAAVAKIADETILTYVRQDNYARLREALAKVGRHYPGYRPDVDIHRGFDRDGFAKDGSEWRAIRFQPFLGSFWPTNGSTDDVFVRLPRKFRVDADGKPSRAIYRINLAILEAAIAADPRRKRGELNRQIEAVDERVIAVDLDADGRQSANVTRIQRLPSHYVGGAAGHKVRRYIYPKGTEFLHTVRYLDPDAPNFTAKRMKELRYSRKVEEPDNWGLRRAMAEERDDKDAGKLPVYRGSPMAGLLNDTGWQLQGFIEDARGRLRLQTEEEHRFCMGCHSSIGVTIDQTFAFARKVPGTDGWRVQDLRGLADRPQVGHEQPEVLTYFKRVGGGDEFRGNTELLERFFVNGRVDEKKVRRAGAQLSALLTPSRRRALQLNKAYLITVREQSFDKGRDPTITPAINVHSRITNGSTDLGKAKKIFRDGRLHLVWN